MKQNFNFKNVALAAMFVFSLTMTTKSMASTDPGGTEKTHHCVTLILANNTAQTYCVGDATACAKVDDCFSGGGSN